MVLRGTMGQQEKPQPSILIEFVVISYNTSIVPRRAEVIERIGEKRTLLDNLLRRNASRIGHIPRRNCLLHDAIEGQMTEVKAVGRRRTQLLDDLRNRRRYRWLKEEAEIEKNGIDRLSIEHKYLP